MFSNLKSTILELNANVSDFANQEKAKKLRKKLLMWGGICIAIGVIGVVACFVAFALLGFNSVRNHSFESVGIIFVPFFLFILFGLVLAVGGTLLKLGLSILIVGEATKFVDKSLNKRCECGNMLTEKDKFCPKCGRAVVKVCQKCKTENERDAEFCSNCGAKL